MYAKGLLLTVLVAVLGCGRSPGPAPEDSLRMNQIQVLGTHNSYHVAPADGVLEALGDRGRNLDYTHRPLDEQLAGLGIRQLELDVFADPDGGRYAEPSGLRLAPGQPALSADMRAPGLKVLHVQDIDYRTTCATLVACLTTIREWSSANPQHVPVLVLIEVKDTTPRAADGIEFVQPIPFGARELQALDAEIRAVFDEGQLLTPDDVRGTHATLNAAIRTSGWPRLQDVRGKVLFALDNTGEHRLRYVDGAPSLKGRVMFVSSPPGEPSSAFLKLNDVLGEEGAVIAEMVAAGYIVRTRADVPTEEARSGDTTRRDKAFASGAQFVSTDYPEASPFGSGYLARLPGAETRAARCNPVSAPVACDAAMLEGGPASAR